MDVTPGLKIRLTKTKSTERVLAPIASQITLLMILNDVGVQDEDSVDSSAFSISTCVDRLAHALEGFISVGQGQIQSSQDPIFLSQMSAACENLEVAKTQLYVAGQVVSSASNNTTAHLGLGKAARDVMQAVLRILVIADDVEVRKCSAAIIAVQEKLKNVGSLKDPHGSTPAFKALSEAMLYLSVVLNQRHKDLVSGIQQEQLVAGLNLLHKGVSSLHMAVQTYLKYPRNSQALVGKQQVLDQVLATLSDLHTVIESDPTDLDPEQSGYFVNNVDKVVEGLAENHRFELSPDFECWVATIVRHAMGVARLCQSTYKHLITNICQRILQSKFRLFELRTTLTYSCTLADTESDYASICEVLLDEFCDVEKQVNMALLNLIVDSCCFAFEPLQNLAHAAIHYQEGMVESLGQSVLAQEFRQHMVRMCQVASMATASAMDSKKVCAVRFSVHRLEQLDPVVLPAVLSAARRPVNVQAVRQLKLLVQEWTKEMDALIQALDSMTDPGIFLYISEQRIQQCANVLRTKIEERDKMGVKNVVKKLLSHSHRMVQVSRRVVDNSCDAVFRNGLLVFVHGMISAGNNLKDATWAVLENTYHVRLVDTLHRRLDLLLQATRDLVQGVKGNNHVDILSSARHNVRHHMEAFTAFTAHYDDGASSNLGTSRKKSNGFTTQKHKTNEHKTDTSMVEVGTVTESPVDITINTCIPDSRSVTTPCNKSCLQKENILQKEHHCRQPGKLTSLLQACGDGLFAVAAARDRMGLSEWSGDILSWTSHLCEAAFCLINHCHQIVRHSEMKELTVAIDKLAAQVIEAARYVAAGDDGHVSTLRQQSEEWIDKCDKMRILVDVAVADWLLLIEQVETVATGQDTEKLKSLLALVERNQREVKRLLGRTREFKHQHIPQGTQVLQFLCEGMSHLEHLTANFKTAAECQATPQSSEDVRNIRSTQFMQQGREWCVLMTCLISELDFISDSLAIAGKSTLGIPFNTASVPTTGIHHSHSSNKMVATSGTHHPHRSKKVVAFLQSETIHLKEILTCLSAGETDMKAQCKELSQALVEILKEVNEIADTPVDDISFPQAQLFARLDAELALSCWMDKALEVDELAKHNCLKYSLFIDNLFPEATGTSPSGIYTGHGRAWSTTVQTALPVLSDKVKVFTQRTLQAIQLSANLQHRATVRRCLDDLNNLVPTITQSAYGCALGSSDSEQKTSELELKKMSVYWGAKVFCLISTLRMMDDIKPSLTDELDRLLRAEWQTWRDSQSLTFHPFTSTHAKDTSVTRERKNTVTESSSTKMDTDSSTQGDSTPLSSSSMKTSSYQRSALYNSWLASANYLAGEVECWEDESNNFVQLVRDMAKQCQQMADFARGGQSLKNSKEMASTAVALAGRGRELEKFACSLQAMCSKGRNTEDLRLAGEKIAMYTCQLRIVANMVQNAPSSPECDSILARNASNLVQAVREMFATAESVSIASQLNPREGSDLDHQVVDLLTRWQQKLASYRLQQANTTNTDALGLRRMERHNPPSLTNLLEN